MRPETTDIEEDGLSASEMSWADNVFGDLNIDQYSMDDQYTPTQVADEIYTPSQCTQGAISASEGDKELQRQLQDQGTKRVPKRKRIDTDYNKKKGKKRNIQHTCSDRVSGSTCDGKSTKCYGKSKSRL